MTSIKFSKEYPKLWEQTKAELLSVRIIMADNISDCLKEYDTRSSDGSYYELPKKGMMLQLIFLGNLRIPFCTIRRHTPEKEKYYVSCIGKTFDIEVVKG